MRRALAVAMLAVAILSLSACGGGEPTPREKADAFVQSVKQDDFARYQDVSTNLQTIYIFTVEQGGATYAEFRSTVIGAPLLEEGKPVGLSSAEIVDAWYRATSKEW